MKTLTVHSFAVHGTASLKAILSILGTRVLPVPSLYLTGLTNIPGFVKTEVQFEALLTGSLALARQRGEAIILYVGYLGQAWQARLVAEAITAYRDIIHAIVIDPVSGDQGRLYVPQDVVEAWPLLLSQADWALPNLTEVTLLSGLSPSPDLTPDVYIEAFRRRFPDTSLIVTSLEAAQDLSLRLISGDTDTVFTHARVARHFGGTGDVFAAWFIYYHYYMHLGGAESMQRAALRTLDALRLAMERNSPDLILEPTAS
ncbi:MAG: bifunctional hydroxymethylpyrimidine kinase/phosphomethylpyrimidine kinase [Bacteroidia bacterium]|nr:bifunctional hydroxymethylpyrimidine kinase/phosphomethylpyrimidine kinase [Bacteroidia bacterium]